MMRDIPTFIVDDEPDVRMLIRLLFEVANHGLSVSGEAATGEEALADPAAHTSSVVIVDQMMPGISGLETAARLREQCPDVRIILCSAHLTTQIRNRAAEIGIDACLSKGEIDQLPDVTRRLSAAAA
jgi:DNA-binding NarL/FixJ family response regulator